MCSIHSQLVCITNVQKTDSVLYLPTRSRKPWRDFLDFESRLADSFHSIVLIATFIIRPKKKRREEEERNRKGREVKERYGTGREAKIRRGKK
jgi:hypothetical protein